MISCCRCKTFTSCSVSSPFRVAVDDRLCSLLLLSTASVARGEGGVGGRRGDWVGGRGPSVAAGRGRSTGAVLAMIPSESDAMLTGSCVVKRSITHFYSNTNLPCLPALGGSYIAESSKL